MMCKSSVTRYEYVCPRCKGHLEQGNHALACDACSAQFPVEDGVVDFSKGHYYDQFDPSRDELDPKHQVALHDEVEGTRWRLDQFYIPRLQLLAATRKTKEPLRVLDCGCGNGLSVDILDGAGFHAWGNDVSMLRKWQWRDRSRRERLLITDGATLPFPDGFFDAVISSGVIEHIGVGESALPDYQVRATPDRDRLRMRFLAELVRVTGSNGRLWLDFPNGAFPIDFWHGTLTRGMRWHSLRESFLPTVGQVRRLIRDVSGGRWVVRATSPRGRLHFRRIRRHWYGTLFLVPMKLLLRVMDLPLGRQLAASPLNPYLVLEVSLKQPADGTIRASGPYRQGGSSVMAEPPTMPP